MDMMKSVDEKLEDISFPTNIHKLHVKMDNFVLDNVDFEPRQKIIRGIYRPVNFITDRLDNCLPD